MPARYAERVSVRAAEYGRGVFAKRAFRTGARVGHMIGRIIKDGNYDPEYAVDLEGGALQPFAPFKYLNHCCEPNCELVELTRPDGTPVIWVYALGPIKAGQQLTIDYAWPAEEAMRCRCGSAKCRGYIVDKKQLSLVAQTTEQKRPSKRPPRAPDLRASDIRVTAAVDTMAGAGRKDPGRSDTAGSGAARQRATQRSRSRGEKSLHAPLG